MTIRSLASADVPAAAALLVSLDPKLTAATLSDRLKTLSARTDHKAWVFEKRGAIVGVMHAYVRPALEKPCEVVVQSIAVDPAHRKTGVGRALMDEAERWAKAQGLASIALHTRNAAAFYASIGYTEIAAPVLMRKTLS